MPVKKLPFTLIERLKKAAPKIKKALGRMKNIDHRKDLSKSNPREIELPGRRIRQMNISRNYPNTELVIKRTHLYNAEKTIRKVKEAVRKHNQKFNPKNYVLLEPEAYAISKHLIAMAKTDAPSLEEILGKRDIFFWVKMWFPEGKTERGKKFFEEMKEKYNVNETQLKEAYLKAEKLTDWDTSNLLLLGFENGKFVFMPLVDIF